MVALSRQPQLPEYFNIIHQLQTFGTPAAKSRRSRLRAHTDRDGVCPYADGLLLDLN